MIWKEWPTKQYSIILADPPWKYASRANHRTRFRGGAYGHYPLLSMEEIKAFPVESIAANRAVLFLWTTFPYLKDQLEVFEAWGFKYKTLGFSWIKLNPKALTPCFGVGFYTKSNCEVCLLGTKGKPLKPVSNAVSSCVIAPRREHSRKPDEVYTRIEQLYGDVPRIELFARHTWPGWDAWGNEL